MRLLMSNQTSSVESGTPLVQFMESLQTREMKSTLSTKSASEPLRL